MKHMIVSKNLPSLRGQSADHVLQDIEDQVLQDIERRFAGETKLIHAISMLYVRAKLIKPTIGYDPEKQASLYKIYHGIRGFARKRAKPYGWKAAAWNEVYRLECLIVLIEPASNLRDEIIRRLDEADAEKVPSAAHLRKTYGPVTPGAVDVDKSPPKLTPADDSLLRAHLLNILEEIQRSQISKYSARANQKRVANKILCISAFSFLFFLFPYLLIYLAVSSNNHAFIKSWCGLPLLSVITAGMFGVCFSRLQHLQSNWNKLSIGELDFAGHWTQIVLRFLVGVIGASVIYFFLHSEVVTGNLIPKFSEVGLFYHRTSDVTDAPSSATDTFCIDLLFPNRQLALLIVWSFVAGFSERLVPSFLAKTEASLESAPSKS